MKKLKKSEPIKRSRPIDIEYKNQEHYHYALSLKAVANDGFPSYGKQILKAPNNYIESLKLQEQLGKHKRVVEKIDVFGYPVRFFNNNDEEIEMKKIKRTKSADSKDVLDNVKRTSSNFSYGRYNKFATKKLQDNYVKRAPSPKHFIDVDDSDTDSDTDDSKPKLEIK